MEFTEGLDDNGRKRAIKVTGPDGQDVQGEDNEMKKQSELLGNSRTN